MALTALGGQYGLYVDVARNNYRAGTVLATTGAGVNEVITSVSVALDKSVESSDIQKETLLARVASLGYSRAVFEKNVTFTFDNANDKVILTLTNAMYKEVTSALIALVAWYTSGGDFTTVRIGDVIMEVSKDNLTDIPFPVFLTISATAPTFTGATLANSVGVMRFNMPSSASIETQAAQAVTISNEETDTIIKVSAVADNIFVLGRAGMDYVVTVGTKLTAGTYTIVGNEVVAGVSSALYLANPTPGTPFTTGADTVTGTVEYKSYVRNAAQLIDSFKQGFYNEYGVLLGDFSWVTYSTTANPNELTVSFAIEGNAERYALVNKWMDSVSAKRLTTNTYALISNAIAYIGKTFLSQRTFYGF